MSQPGSRGRQDVQRFEAVYGHTFEAVAAYLLARTDRDSAAAALSRTFEIPWRRQADLPPEPLPWLPGVARRVLADQRRSQGRRDALIERIATPLSESGHDHAGTLAHRERLLGALAQLSAKQREALLLVAWEGLEQEQAAIVLGCSRAALAVRVHRGRARLRRLLSTDPATSPTARATSTPRRETP